MIIKMADLAAPIRYQWMTQAVIPRPVAWVLSANDDGGHNLAPFSYFNALASEPPLVGISFTQKEGGGNKDTLHNIRQRTEFVVHIAAMAQLPDLNQTAAPLPYGDSEVAKGQLDTTPWEEDFPLPRLREAPLALACRRHQEHALGGGQVLIIGEIIYLYANEAVLAEDAKGRQVIDASKVDPVARLSAGKYAGLSEVVTLARPT